MRIIIGTSSPWISSLTEADCQKAAIDCNFMHLEASEAVIALLSGRVDALASPMDLLPITQDEGIAITAVSERRNPAERLAIRQEAWLPTAIYRIQPGAQVGVNSPLQAAQLRALREDLHFIDAPFDASALEAFFLSSAENGPKTGYKVLDLHPLEFVPPAGKGVIAWSALADNLPVRRVLKPMHHSNVSACTNVERKVLQLLGANARQQLGVYCECDAGGNYHALAMLVQDGQLQHARISQNTTIGLAERLLEKIQG